jgi:hypothetical protein
MGHEARHILGRLVVECPAIALHQHVSPGICAFERMLCIRAERVYEERGWSERNKGFRTKIHENSDILLGSGVAAIRKTRVAPCVRWCPNGGQKTRTDNEMQMLTSSPTKREQLCTTEGVDGSSIPICCEKSSRSPTSASVDGIEKRQGPSRWGERTSSGSRRIMF